MDIAPYIMQPLPFDAPVRRRLGGGAALFMQVYKS